MKFFATLLLCVFSLTNHFTYASGNAATGDDPRLTLLDSTPIKARFSRTISSADAKVGDTIDLEILEDIIIGNTIVIPKGGTAIATVTQAKPKGRMGKGGKLDIAIDYVRLVNGEKAALRGVKENKGGGSTGAMTGAIVATSLIFLPAAPLFLFMKGKDTSIPKGTEITVYVNGDTQIDLSKGRGGQTNNSSRVTVSPAGTASLSINATPSSADVEINGKYVGSTPSTFSLPAGDHMIVIKKSGYAPWERTITLSAGGTITINAELQKKD